MIQLGQRVRDVVTGFTGIADCRMVWLNKCVRIQVRPRATEKDGAQVLGDPQSFDEEQLEVLDGDPVVLPGAKPAQTGGDHPTPPMRSDPTR